MGPEFCHLKDAESTLSTSQILFQNLNFQWGFSAVVQLYKEVFTIVNTVRTLIEIQP